MENEKWMKNEKMSNGYKCPTESQKKDERPEWTWEGKNEKMFKVSNRGHLFVLARRRQGGLRMKEESAIYK